MVINETTQGSKKQKTPKRRSEKQKRGGAETDRTHFRRERGETEVIPEHHMEGPEPRERGDERPGAVLNLAPQVLRVLPRQYAGGFTPPRALPPPLPLELLAFISKRMGIFDARALQQHVPYTSVYEGVRKMVADVLMNAGINPQAEMRVISQTLHEGLFNALVTRFAQGLVRFLPQGQELVALIRGEHKHPTSPFLAQAYLFRSGETTVVPPTRLFAQLREAPEIPLLATSEMHRNHIRVSNIDALTYGSISRSERTAGILEAGMQHYEVSLFTIEPEVPHLRMKEVLVTVHFSSASDALLFPMICFLQVLEVEFGIKGRMLLPKERNERRTEGQGDRGMGSSSMVEGYD